MTNSNENLINEFTSKIYPNETITASEYKYYEEAIKELGLTYYRRVTSFGTYYRRVNSYDPKN